MEQTTILKLSGLSKKFDSRTAVDHISLEIREGEIFGLLGPNGHNNLVRTQKQSP